METVLIQSLLGIECRSLKHDRGLSMNLSSIGT